MIFRDGEQVTILPPYTDDPVIIEHQHYGVISGRADGGFLVRLDATLPPGQIFGPFPAERLARGWRDSTGRWRP